MAELFSCGIGKYKNGQFDITGFSLLWARCVAKTRVKNDIGEEV